MEVKGGAILTGLAIPAYHAGMLGPCEQVALTIPRDAYFLGLVRQAVTAVAHRAGLDAREAGEVEIAVDEAVTRMVGYVPPTGREAGDAAIEVEIRLDREALLVTLADRCGSGDELRLVRYLSGPRSSPGCTP